jgi:hypothetical protein
MVLPILRYLFALLKPLTARASFRFLALSYRPARRSERMKSDADNFHDTLPLKSAAGPTGRRWNGSEKIQLTCLVRRELLNV